MTRIQLRRANASSWASVNPVLALGEAGVETDTYKIKVGDGVSLWNDLPYFVHDWADLTGKPTVIAAGATKAAARSAIDAASLDANGKVPISELPNSIMVYQGVWDADTNTPTLLDGSGNVGDVYRVSVAGDRNLGSGTISFNVGDYVIYNSSEVWEKSDTTDAVATVAGRTGNVVLTAADVGLGNVDNTSNATERAAFATLTNKRITPRVYSFGTASVTQFDTDNFDQYNILALAQNPTLNLAQGVSPTDGQKFLVRIKDNGAARTLNWDLTKFVSSGAATLPTTTVAGKTHLVGFIYDGVAAKWVCVAADGDGY